MRQLQPEGGRWKVREVRRVSRKGGLLEVTVDLAYRRLGIVNVIFYGLPGARDWVLIDAGLPHTTELIARAAAARFGKGSRPAAIILTHGHFDHVGALGALAERWDVPIYAHPLEHPYLTGRSRYPPPDPGVGGGLLAWSAGLYPRGPVDVRPWLRALPEDGSAPEMPGWRWLPTPGHTPGHISLWREADRLLIAGDAVVSTKQESATAVAQQRPELRGPPRYFTQDWGQAERSVRALAELEPERLVTGHGPVLAGPALRQGLWALARTFRAWAVPRRGRYVQAPARADRRGTVYVPPPVSPPHPEALPLGLALLAGSWWLYRRLRRSDRR